MNLPTAAAGSLAALIATAPALACGAPGAATRVQGVASGDIVLENGRRARLAGLALEPAAAPALAGLSVRVAGLAPSPDRWGRDLVDLIGDDGRSVALDLLERGLARVRPEFETRACEGERLDAEAGARVAGEGVWAAPNAVLAARDLDALKAADGRFVIVEGVVRRVGVSATKVYLDFAGRDGFSVVAARKIESQFRRSGLDVRALVGRNVIVRGVLDLRFGPRIELADPAMIEPSGARPWGTKEKSRGG